MSLKDGDICWGVVSWSLCRHQSSFLHKLKRLGYRRLHNLTGCHTPSVYSKIIFGAGLSHGIKLQKWYHGALLEPRRRNLSPRCFPREAIQAHARAQIEQTQPCCLVRYMCVKTFCPGKHSKKASSYKDGDVGRMEMRKKKGQSVNSFQTLPEGWEDTNCN